MCQYCSGDNQSRPDILWTDDNPVCLWTTESGETMLLADDGEATSVTIHYCPMCGREL